jgi:glycosyltransferase involved in cell wall biosynthesis
VIATPNCGEAVQPEQSGLIVPIREAAALADAIRRFARDRAFLTHCAAGARERSKDFSMEALGANLRQLE